MTAAAAIAFPPLMSGRAVAGDAFDAAREAAGQGVDAGTIFHGVGEERLEAALVLAPETPLAEALPVTFAVGLGLADAIGALAPPEVGVHLVWPDRVKVNGAFAGALRAAASTDEPAKVPDWLVVAVELDVAARRGGSPGETPDRTTLHDEGCADVGVGDLLEAFARHTMSWLHVFLSEGFRPVHEAWRQKADGLGETIAYPEPGRFTGIDESGGLLLSRDGRTDLVPLARMLEHTR